MRYITFFVLNFFLSVALFSQPLYLPYRKGNLWGVYDTYKNQFVVPCKYDSVADINTDLFAFRHNKLWGALNTKGIEVIPAKYEWLEISALQSENIPIRVKNGGKWGCLSSKGKEYLACEYDSIGTFIAPSYEYTASLIGDDYNSDGKFSEIQGKQLYFITANYAVISKNNRFGILHKDGRKTLLPEYEAIKIGFGEVALVKKEKLWGVLDFQGKEIIPIGYDSVIQVGEYASKVGYILQYKGKWGFKNANGHTVLPFDYEEVVAGDVIRMKQNGKWGFADLQVGNILSECKYDYIYSSFLRPQSGGSEYGIEGEAYEPIYEMVENELLTKMKNDTLKMRAFMEDEKNQAEIAKLSQAKEEELHKDMTEYADEKFLKVKQNGKMGIVTQNGKSVLPCEYDDVMVFPYKNKFWVRKNKKWGLINRKQELLVPYQYDKFFRSSKAEMNGKWILLEVGTGLPKQPCCNYEDIEDAEGGYKIKNKGKWGIINEENKPIIPCEYTQIKESYMVFQVFKGKKFGYLDLNGKELFRCEYEENRDEFSHRKDGKFGIFALSDEISVAIPFEYDTLYDATGYEYANGNLVVVKNKKYGLYKENTLIIPCKYDSMKCFNETNINIWAKENAKWGMLNENGKTTIPFDYQDVKVERKHEYADNYPFYAIVKKGGKWGAINESNGKEVMPFEYQNVVFLKNDSVVWVQKNNLWGLYSLLSKRVILPCQYDNWETWNMENIVDRDMAIEMGDSLPLIVKMSSQESNYFKVSKKGKWGVVLLESGMELIPCKYSQVMLNEKDIFSYDDMELDIKAFKVKLAGKWGWADIFGKEYFE